MVPIPFLGRGELFANALTALQERRVVAFYGTEGLGKTRLATELAQALAPAPSKRAIIRGSSELQQFPFAAALHLLRAELDTTNPMTALREATDDLRSQPIVILVVDDVHLLDASTDAAVHSLATRAGPRLVLTARTASMPESFRRLERDHNALVVGLDPLDDSAIRALCSAVAGCGLSQSAQSRLLALAQGNPLLATELTRAGLQSGSLAMNGAVLDLASPLPTAKLRDLVSGHLGALDANERRAMELVALAEPISARVLTRVVDAKIVAALQERGVVTERTERRGAVETSLFISSHPLFTEAVLADVPAFRRSMHYVDLADAVSREGAVGPDDATRQALWLHRAGHDISSADLMATVSQYESARVRWLLGSISHERSSSDLTERTDSSRLLASSTRDRYAESARLAEIAYEKDPSAANAIVLLTALVSTDHALDRAVEVIDQQIRVGTNLMPNEDFDLRRVARLVHGYHRLDTKRAREIVDRRPIPQGKELAVAVELATIDAYDGEFEKAATAMVTAMQEPQIEPFVKVTAAVELSILRLADGKCHDAIDLVDEHFPVAVANGALASLLASMWWVRCVSAAYDARFDQAEPMLLSAFNSSVGGDSIEGAGFFADGLAAAARLHGRFRTAVRRARQSVDLLAIRDVGQRTHALGELVLSLCALGEVVPARAALDELEAATSNAPMRGSVKASVPLARTFVELLEGRSMSQASFDAVWNEIGNGHALSRSTLLWIASVTGNERWAQSRAPELRSLQGRLPALQLDALDAVGGDGETFDALHSRALELDARAIAHLVASFALQSPRVKPSMKPEWERREERARQSCEGVRPYGDELHSRTSGLSRRERHIARLAQSGLTDALIAEQLGLSVRTVESHLTRAYAKLAISGRRDLTTISLDS